jgi:hypothetical protein
LKPGGKWSEKVDLNAFEAYGECYALGRKMELEQGDDDVRHMNKMIMWNNLFAASGSSRSLRAQHARFCAALLSPIIPVRFVTMSQQRILGH